MVLRVDTRHVQSNCNVWKSKYTPHEAYKAGMDAQPLPRAAALAAAAAILIHAIHAMTAMQ